MWPLLAPLTTVPTSTDNGEGTETGGSPVPMLLACAVMAAIMAVGVFGLLGVMRQERERLAARRPAGPPTSGG